MEDVVIGCGEEEDFIGARVGRSYWAECPFFGSRFRSWRGHGRMLLR
jgi:hypothetical protein